MDDNIRRRRHEQARSSGANNRYPVQDPNDTQRSYVAGDMTRYRPTSLGTSAAASRNMAGVTSFTGYYQEPVAAFSQQNAMAYQPDYGQDSRQPQSYGTYNTPMLYNVPQASAQASVYDTSPQFSSRQAAGLQLMPTDVAAAPYFSGESTNAAAVANLQPQTASSSTSAVYQQNQANQRMMHQNYNSSLAPISGIPQTSSSEPVVEEEEYTNTAPESATEPAQDPAQAQMGEAYERYLDALREIFTNISNGMLRSASVSLLRVSEWLLSKVVDLGLTSDDESLHQDRIKLWRDFNYAWLALCQKELDTVLSGFASQDSDRSLGKEKLTRMGNELVRLCSTIERHGLVDYECGVWEEQIIDVLLRCIDAYGTDQPEVGASGTGSSGSGHSSQRGI